MRCIVCPSDEGLEADIDGGVPGGSARREYDRRVEKRSAELRGRFGERAGGFIARLTEEPASTRSWQKGAAGEETLAGALAGIPGVRVLHDRRVRGKRWNIDHVVFASAGIFVVDSKNYRGTVRIRRRGSFFHPQDRLYVGSRDCTSAVDAMAWQVDAIEAAFVAAGISPVPLVTPVLCFIGADWQFFGAPSRFEDVFLESERSIRKLVARPGGLSADELDRFYRVIATALPPK
jgi:hypothetical protein